MCGVWYFFFKQKTAYELRISDWSSDVCSSDLQGRVEARPRPRPDQQFRLRHALDGVAEEAADPFVLEAVRLVEHQQVVGPVHGLRHQFAQRSEARSVGKECVSKCRSRRSPEH